MSEYDWKCKKTKFAADQQRILELRELNAELLNIARRLAALEHKDGGRTFPSPHDCAEARRVIAKAKELGY